MEYGANDSWDRMLQSGLVLLDRFAQHDRIRIPNPQRNLQLKVSRAISLRNEFVGFVDAIGELDGVRCIIDWKTTTSRYSDETAALLHLDPQLLCYSWLTGEANVAFVVF